MTNSTSHDLVTILKSGRKTLRRIYSDFRHLRKDKIAPTFEAEIRNTLQRCCPESSQFNGKDSLFKHHGLSVWSLRE